MTAELAVLNRSAVALGADSAATVRRKIDDFNEETKVFNGANKIFGISRAAPVGVMIFGDASFMGVPWETLIKAYRKHIGPKKFNTLVEYAHDFFTFLEEHPHLFPAETQDDAVFQAIARYGLRIKKAIDETQGKRACNRALRSEITNQYAFMLGQPLIGDLTESECRRLQSKHEDKLDFAIDHLFSGYLISKPNRARLKQILTGSFTRLWYADAASGVVFAGFGEDEFFPHLASFYADGIYEDRCSYVRDAHHAIDRDNTSQIIPFAQTEMVQTFVYGYDPSFEELIRAVLHQAFEEFINEARNHAGSAAAKQLRKTSQQIEQKFKEMFVKWVVENHYAPIRRILDVLSKDELADLVETLITMESVKKRVTAPIESVGGPVDVAVISKSEGLIWIKRKHYFDPEKNFEFFERVRSEIND